jgi:hypothetical protein
MDLRVQQPVDTVSSLYDSGRVCSDCEEAIYNSDGVVLVQVVLPQVVEGRVVLQDFEEPVTGGYAYEPFLFHEQCWGSNYDVLLEYLEEECCEAVPTPHSFSTCAACGSGLLPGEPTGLLSYGTLSVSPRTPNFEPSVVFTRGQRHQLLCLSCLRTVNEEVIEMWTTLSYAGECALCTYERRWRTNTPCDHDLEDEEDGES